jgi:aspartokinase/homoserine dehydrogenase 1
MEMSYFGAKVIHPPTMLPALEHNIPIHIKNTFEPDAFGSLIDRVVIERGLSIIAAVGENMRQRHGIAGRMFQALGRNGINVTAIAQGSSELNISVVIKREDEAKALNVIHDAFFLSDTRSLNIFLAGTGLIGGALLRQIGRQRAFLKAEHGIDIRVVALADSKRMCFDIKGIPPGAWEKGLKASKEGMDIKKFIANCRGANLQNSVFVDCTASEGVARSYADVLKASISIVTPNKKANSGRLSYYKRLKSLAAAHNVKFLYETNVGAGLPVINTLDDLIATGDKILKIEAVLSGTLSYIFNSFTGKRVFSDCVREAQRLGYTEPDPRDDLSGLDAARKLLVLGREIGLQLEPEDIKVESLVLSDAELGRRKARAEKNGHVLRYIASIEGGRASVSLKEVGREHPFYNLSGSDNIISFTTERYKKTPLVIKGPGAGAEVTAAGVFADILRISSYLS